MADIQIIIGYETVTQADQAFKILDKTVKSTASQYEKAFNKVTSWQKKFSNEQNKVNSSLNEQHLAQQKSNKSARESAKAFEDAARAVEKEADSLRSLRMATDVVYRNQQKRLQMKKLLKSAIAAETMTTEQAIVALKRYNAAQMSSNKIMGMSKNKMNGSNVAVQQLGYQMGDFAVQVQGGTSAFVAFSQQATQLVGILPMVAGPLGLTMGAAVGLSAALGIIIPIGSAVARMFFDMKDSSKGAEEGVDNYTAAIKRLIDNTKELKNSRLGIDPTVAFINEERVRLIDEITLKTQKMDAAQEKGGRNKGRSAGFRTQIADLQLLLDAENNRLAVITKAYNKETNLAREGEQSSNRRKSQIEERFSAEEQLMNMSVSVHKDTQSAIDKRNEVSSNVYQNQIKHRFREEEKLMGMSVEIHNKAQIQKAKAAIDAAKATSLADAERMLGEQMADKARDDALATFNADVLATSKTLDAVFKSRTLSYSVRFAGDESVMSQGFGGPSKTKMSYSELKASGLSDDQIKAMGVNIPKTKKTGGGGKTDKEKLAEYLEGKKQEQILEEQLVGVLGEERQIQTELFNIKNQYEGVITPKQEKELENILRLTQAERDRQEVVEEAAEQQEQLANFIGDSMENAMMGIVDGTLSVKDAFKSMAADIIKELYRVLVVQEMVAAAKSALFGGGLFGGASWSADGDVVGSSGIQAYADGGVVNSPTMFKHGGGLGVMGEAGPEAIMPLKRGANGKLGVQVEGKSSNNSVTVIQNNTFGSGVTQSEVQAMLPKMVEASKAAVFAAQRRSANGR